MQYRNLIPALCLASLGTLCCENGEMNESTKKNSTNQELTAGTYRVKVGGSPATVKITNSGYCHLKIDTSTFQEYTTLLIHDFDCDGETDGIFSTDSGIWSLSLNQLTPQQKEKTGRFLRDAYSQIRGGLLLFLKPLPDWTKSWNP